MFYGWGQRNIGGLAYEYNADVIVATQSVEALDEPGLLSLLVGEHIVQNQQDLLSLLFGHLAL